MDKNRRGWTAPLAAAVLLVLAGGLGQLYLKNHLVVAVEETHHHAHSEHLHEDHEAGGGEAAGFNLVTNYSFEVGGGLDLYGWTADCEDPGTSVWRDQGVSAYGFSSAALRSREGSRGVDLALSQRIEGELAGREVTVRGSIKAEDLQGNAFLRLTAAAAPQEEAPPVVWLDLAEVSGTADWQVVQGSVFLPPEVTAVDLAVGIFGSGTAWFDGISLTAADSSPAPPPRGVNLLRNPDFSQSALYWHFFSVPDTPRVDWEVREDGVSAGPYLFMRQAAPTGDGQYSGFYQVVNGLGGSADLATFGGRLKTEGLEGEAWLNLTFYGRDGRHMAETERSLSGTRDWEYLELTVPLPAGAESVWARLIFIGTGAAAFDDLDLRLSPLP